MAYKCGHSFCAICLLKWACSLMHECGSWHTPITCPTCRSATQIPLPLHHNYVERPLETCPFVPNRTLNGLLESYVQRLGQVGEGESSWCFKVAGVLNNHKSLAVISMIWSWTAITCPCLNGLMVATLAKIGDSGRRMCPCAHVNALCWSPTVAEDKWRWAHSLIPGERLHSRNSSLWKSALAVKHDNAHGNYCNKHYDTPNAHMKTGSPVNTCCDAYCTWLCPPASMPLLPYLEGDNKIW